MKKKQHQSEFTIRESRCEIEREQKIERDVKVLGRRLDKWMDENTVVKEGLGYISALQALGVKINEKLTGLPTKEKVLKTETMSAI
jgi:hypothetical protein